MNPQHWLNIATQGLAPQSAERVRGEHLAYLEDALEAGETEAAVLTEWGDPHRANRELKKAHLTSSEAKWLPAGYAPTWSGFGKALLEDIGVLGAMTFLFTRDAMRGEFSLAGLALITIGLLAVCLRWVALSRLTLSPRMRALSHWLLAPASIVVLALLAMIIREGTLLTEIRELAGSSVVGLIIFSFMAYHFYRLYASLRAARKAEAQAA